MSKTSCFVPNCQVHVDILLDIDHREKKDTKRRKFSFEQFLSGEFILNFEIDMPMILKYKSLGNTGS